VIEINPTKTQRPGRDVRAFLLDGGSPGRYQVGGMMVILDVQFGEIAVSPSGARSP